MKKSALPLTVRPEYGRGTVAWAPALLMLAESQAGRGNLRLAADLCEALLGDDRIAGLLRTRAQALFGLTPTFVASGGGDGRRRNRAVKAVELDEDWWEMMSVETATLHLIWGLLLGVSLGRLEWWETVRGKRVPRIRKGRNVPLVTWWHPRVLRWDEPTQAWYVRLSTGKEERIEPGNGEWLLYTPYGATAPWMLALWRGLARLWLLKHYGIRDLGRHLEKGSTLVIQSAEKSIKEQRQKVFEQTENLGADGLVVLPPGYTMNLLEARSTGEMYLDTTEYVDKAFAVAILSHANNAEVLDAKTGSNAGQALRHEGREFDARSFEGWSHDQVLKAHAANNFGDEELAPWAAYPTEPDASAAEEGAGMKSLGDGLASVQGVSKRVDVDAVLEKHGVPLLAEPVETTTPPPKKAPPAKDEKQPADEGAKDAA